MFSSRPPLDSFVCPSQHSSPSLPHTDFAPFPVLSLPCYPSPPVLQDTRSESSTGFLFLLSLCLIVNYCFLAFLVFSISQKTKKEDAPLVDNRASAFLSLVDLWLLHSAVAADTAFYCPSNLRALPTLRPLLFLFTFPVLKPPPPVFIPSFYFYTIS